MFNVEPQMDGHLEVHLPVISFGDFFQIDLPLWPESATVCCPNKRNVGKKYANHRWPVMPKVYLMLGTESYTILNS